MTTATTRKLGSTRILVVEDDPVDRRMIQRAKARGCLSSEISFIEDGGAAMAWADALPALSPSERPDMILLDLNLPRASGFEVLERLKALGCTARIPVVIVTSSDQPAEIRKAYEIGAISYVLKSADVSAFFERLERVEQYWFDTVLPPSWN